MDSLSRPYACNRCGLTGVKLWRTFGVFDGTAELVCLKHADAWSQQLHSDFGMPNIIGDGRRFVPAIPAVWVLPQGPEDPPCGGWFMAWADECAGWSEMPASACDFGGLDARAGNHDDGIGAPTSDVTGDQRSNADESTGVSPEVVSSATTSSEDPSTGCEHSSCVLC